MTPFIDAIHSNFPDLPIVSVELAGEGMDSIALLVNREWVFRFPKHDGVSAGTELEARLLPELQQAIDVRIPVPEFVGTDPRTGRRFSGYRKVEGAPLDAHVFLGLDTGRQDRLTARIARFVRQLHSFPMERAIQLGVAAGDFRGAYADKLASVRALVLPRVNPDERRYVERLYGAYLDDPGNFDYEPCLLHADLSPEHVFVDPATRAVTGIIDFGDVTIGDPDYELQRLYADYGDRFLQTYLAVNPHPCPNRLRRKLRFFDRASTLDDALFGLRRNEPDVVEVALALLRKQASG